MNNNRNLRRGHTIPNIGMPQKNAISINPDDLESCKCDCGSVVYIKLFQLKRIPAPISPNGHEAILPAETYVCASCQKPFATANTQYERKKSNKTNDENVKDVDNSITEK